MDDDNNLGMVRILVAEVVANGNWPMRENLLSGRQLICRLCDIKPTVV
jgi:hypothetical protein